jgi:hypothetical protein
MRFYQILNVNLFILLFSVVSKKNFDRVKSYWVPHLALFLASRNAAILLVGNKIDLRHMAECRDKMDRHGHSHSTFQMGLDLSKEIGAVGYMECSATLGIGVQDVFNSAFTLASGIMKSVTPIRAPPFLPERTIFIETVKKRKEHECNLWHATINSNEHIDVQFLVKKESTNLNYVYANYNDLYHCIGGHKLILASSSSVMSRLFHLDNPLCGVHEEDFASQETVNNGAFYPTCFTSIQSGQMHLYKRNPIHKQGTLVTLSPQITVIVWRCVTEFLYCGSIYNSITFAMQEREETKVMEQLGKVAKVAATLELNELVKHCDDLLEAILEKRNWKRLSFDFKLPRQTLPDFLRMRFFPSFSSSSMPISHVTPSSSGAQEEDVEFKSKLELIEDDKAAREMGFNMVILMQSAKFYVHTSIVNYSPMFARICNNLYFGRSQECVLNPKDVQKYRIDMGDTAYSVEDGFWIRCRINPCEYLSTLRLYIQFLYTRKIEIDSLSIEMIMDLFELAFRSGDDCILYRCCNSIRRSWRVRTVIL